MAITPSQESKSAKFLQNDERRRVGTKETQVVYWDVTLSHAVCVCVKLSLPPT